MRKLVYVVAMILTGCSMEVVERAPSPPASFVQTRSPAYTESTEMNLLWFTSNRANITCPGDSAGVLFMYELNQNALSRTYLDTCTRVVDVVHMKAQGFVMFLHYDSIGGRWVSGRCLLSSGRCTLVQY